MVNKVKIKSHFHGKGKLILEEAKEVYEGEFVKDIISF